MIEDDYEFFKGNKLIGNDFNYSEILQWYSDEENAYAKLLENSSSSYEYSYHEFNKFHAMNFLANSYWKNEKINALGLGAAYGDEFQPISNILESITIVDPSDKFQTKHPSLNVKWVKPLPSGIFEFNDACYDLVTSLGALHHIPNVEFVLQEIHRVLRKDGLLVLREPVVSMGDWNKDRPGLTKRERGIPLNILLRFFSNIGFKIEYKQLCMFTPFPVLLSKMGYSGSIYNNKLLTLVDHLLSKVFTFNASTYHRKTVLSKIAPSSVYFILRK